MGWFSWFSCTPITKRNKLDHRSLEYLHDNLSCRESSQRDLVPAVDLNLIRKNVYYNVLVSLIRVILAGRGFMNKRYLVGFVHYVLLTL